MSDTQTLTTEQHTDRLMAEVDYEIDRYGLPALADTISSILAARCGDDEQHTRELEYYRRARHLFEELRDRLLRLPAPNAARCQEQMENGPTVYTCQDNAGHSGAHRHNGIRWN